MPRARASYSGNPRNWYTCDDCKERSQHKRHEFSRAARPKCPACGCSRLTACGEGVDNITAIRDRKKEIIEQQLRHVKEATDIGD